MTQITLGRLDQVRNQVMPALELDVDLTERRLEPVPQCHQVVVCPRQPQQDNDDNQGDDAQNSPHGCNSLGSSQSLPVLPRGTESFRPLERFPILRSAATGIKREQDAWEKKWKNRRSFPSLRSPHASSAE